MIFAEQTVKGVPHYFLDERLEDRPLRIHVSEVAPGERSHPPHQHPGVEAFYMLAGQATLEIDGEQLTLRAGEVAVFDSTRLHGLANSGTEPMRYAVIIRP